MACLATPLRFLPVLPAELRLSTVLKSGQSFRWVKFDDVRVTRPDQGPSGVLGEEWAFPWRDRTVVLRQDDTGLHYRSLYPLSASRAPFLADLKDDTTLPFLRKYFRLDTKLVPLYAHWAASDPHFARKLDKSRQELAGIRLLEQDPWEALFCFICSSNNNISRITLMVNRAAAELGEPLPHPNAFTADCVHHTPSTLDETKPLPPSPSPREETLYSFPAPESLVKDHVPALLRELGFGYRDKFIHATALRLVDSPSDHLESLHASTPGSTIGNTREKLLEFVGVGPKVADCVALFSLGWDNLVPVDTHVFQIAIRDYSFPASKSTSLTPALHARVAERLQTLWGPYAGWTQQVLFFADLKPSSTTTSSASSKVTPIKQLKRENDDDHADGPLEVVGPVKSKWQMELEELQATPGKKRSTRRVVVKIETETKMRAPPKKKARRAATTTKQTVESPLSRKGVKQLLA